MRDLLLADIFRFQYKHIVYVEYMAGSIIRADACVRDVLDTVFPGRTYAVGLLSQFWRRACTGSQLAGRCVFVAWYIRQSNMADYINRHFRYRAYRDTSATLEQAETQ